MTLLLLRAVDDDRVSPGVLGFLVVALLGVATWLLVKSMTKHLKRVDIPSPSTEEDNKDSGTAAGGPPA